MAETIAEPKLGGWREHGDGGGPGWQNAAYPGWHAWRGVPGTGYYARRIGSTPPVVVGPMLRLDGLGTLIVRAADRRPR